MASFTLDGETYDNLRSSPGHGSEETQSWTYGLYPKVMASVPLAAGGTVNVYAEAQRWNPTQIIVGWDDDNLRPHWAWIPAGNVRTVTVSD